MEFLLKKIEYIFQVRHQISSIMATALSLDIEYGEDGLNMGNGYPGLSDLLEFIMPKLKINFHNPSLNGHSIRQQNGNAQDHDENSSRYLLFDFQFSYKEFFRSNIKIRQNSLASNKNQKKLVYRE